MEKSYIIPMCYAYKAKYSEEYIMFEKLKNLFVEELQIDEADITVNEDVWSQITFTDLTVKMVVPETEEENEEIFCHSVTVHLFYPLHRNPIFSQHSGFGSRSSSDRFCGTIRTIGKTLSRD